MHLYQLLQAGGQGEEEELLQPGEGWARRETEGKEKKSTLVPRDRLLSHVGLVMDFCTI